MLPTNFEDYLVTWDRPEERDYIYEDHFSSEEASGQLTVWKKELMKIWDQFDQRDTHRACTCYGLGWIFNGYNVAEYDKNDVEFEQEDPKYKWGMFQSTRWYPDVWSNLQTMMKYYRKKWWIEWNMVSKTMQGSKNALDNGFLIYTGTNRCDWRKTSSSGIFVKKINWGWHAFFIVWYTEIGFIAVNSFGADWWTSWYFIIPFENYNDLFTKNVIFDKDDTWVIKNLNYEREKKEAIELWITNWDRPNDPVTRSECSVMALRASKLKQ